jgi:Metallo-peptidase family M12
MVVELFVKNILSPSVFSLFFIKKIKELTRFYATLTKANSSLKNIQNEKDDNLPFPTNTHFFKPFRSKQVMKAVTVARNNEKPYTVSALNRATTLEPLANTFMATNTAVQFVADAAVLSQMERTKPTFVAFSIPVSDNETMVLELILMDIFGDKFKVMNAQNQTVNVSKGVFYKGVIKGDDNSVVSLSLSNGELGGIISNDNGNYILGKIKNASNYIFYNDRELLEKSKFDCGVEETVEHHVEETRQMALSESLVCSSRPIQIYMEADNSIYTAQGSNITTSTAFVNALFGQVAVLYPNEGITVQLSQLKIWDTADPYAAATTTNAMLTSFVAQVGTTFTGDLAHLISARSVGGGLADGFESLCNKGAAISGSITSTVVNVPVYSWNVMVVTHELGHNFGSRHTHSCTWLGGAIDNCSDTEGNCPRGPAPVNGGTIMSYCHQVAGVGINLANGFGTLPGNLIRNKVNFCIYTSKLAVTVVSTSANTTAACNGFQIVVAATGGTGAKTFSIAPNVGSQTVSGTFTGLTPGTYVFTTTDANGCTATISTTITEAFAFTAVPEMVSCDGTTSGRIVAAPTNNSNAFNYSISPNVGTQSPSGRFNNLPTGTYTITATFVGDATCPVTRTATLVARPAFGIDAPSVFKANVGVSDGRILIGGISGSKPYTFTLSPNAGT